MRQTLLSLCALLYFLAEVSHAADGPPAPAAKPNFILINIDDLGYADVGPFGSKLNATPNLDRMAAEGRRLTCFYAAPLCSPSRASLMTGCYAKRVLPIPGVLFPAAEIGLNPAEWTVAELLKDQGYATACIGKWHLGDQPEFLPARQGFDYFFGLPYSNDMGPAADGVKSSLGQPIPKPKATGPVRPGRDKTGLAGFDQPPLPLMENERVLQRVRAADQQTLVERYTQRAVEFIRDNKDRAFFLYLPHTAVHFPLYPGEQFQGTSKNGLYGDWVQEVDWSVGQVLDTVCQLQLDRKTLLLFTSDNGGTALGVNAPLRGFKGTTWEGGVRVPTIAWWPGTIPAGTATDEITGMIDILPTLVNLAGGHVVDQVEGRKVDGRDIWPLLTGEPGAKSPHDAFYYFRGLKLDAVRSGPWKLHLANGELYNLDADVGESKNLSAAHPDVVQRLHDLAESMNEDLGADGLGPGCRPPGRVNDPRPLGQFP